MKDVAFLRQKLKIAAWALDVPKIVDLASLILPDNRHSFEQIERLRWNLRKWSERKIDGSIRDKEFFPRLSTLLQQDADARYLQQCDPAQFFLEINIKLRANRNIPLSLREIIETPIYKGFLSAQDINVDKLSELRERFSSVYIGFEAGRDAEKNDRRLYVTFIEISDPDTTQGCLEAKWSGHNKNHPPYNGQFFLYNDNPFLIFNQGHENDFPPNCFIFQETRANPIRYIFGLGMGSAATDPITPTAYRVIYIKTDRAALGVPAIITDDDQIFERIWELVKNEVLPAEARFKLYGNAPRTEKVLAFLNDADIIRLLNRLGCFVSESRAGE